MLDLERKYEPDGFDVRLRDQTKFVPYEYSLYAFMLHSADPQDRAIAFDFVSNIDERMATIRKIRAAEAARPGLRRFVAQSLRRIANHLDRA